MGSKTDDIERIEQLIDTLVTSFRVLADDLHAFNSKQTTNPILDAGIENNNSSSHTHENVKIITQFQYNGEIQRARERGYDAAVKLEGHLRSAKAHSRHCSVYDGIKTDCNCKSKSQSKIPHRDQKAQQNDPNSLPPDHTSKRMDVMIEKDFTTPGGRPSTLQCPFASSASTPLAHNQKPLTPPPTRYNPGSIAADPIAAEFYSKERTSPPPSITDSAPKCPIRYLDQHSPEELANYFENHKHEIPRSHEVCVKRYRSNTESIRLLDAKYGSLVNMIQGLGVKHQPLLPTKEEEAIAAEERQTNERVERWAEKLSTNGDTGDEAGGQEDDREGRFERSLKEIRVGESPSRPWGISVPIVDPPTDDTSPHEEKVIHQRSRSDLEEARSEKRMQCPFDSFGPGKTIPPGHPSISQEKHHNDAVSNAPIQINPSSIIQNPGMMTFTGPVFIGYTPEQAAGILEAMGRSKKTSM